MSYKFYALAPYLNWETRENRDVNLLGDEIDMNLETVFFNDNEDATPVQFRDITFEVDMSIYSSRF